MATCPRAREVFSPGLLPKKPMAKQSVAERCILDIWKGCLTATGAPMLVE